MKRIKEASIEELEDFNGVVRPIITFLDKYWDVGAKPKGYDEYLKTYKEFDDMPLENELDFDGFCSATAGSFSIETQLAMPYVAYGDTEQGRNPLETLIGAVMSYAIQIGERRAKLQARDRTDKLGEFIDVILKSMGDDNATMNVKDCKDMIVYLKRDIDYIHEFFLKK